MEMYARKSAQLHAIKIRLYVLKTKEMSLDAGYKKLVETKQKTSTVSFAPMIRFVLLFVMLRKSYAKLA